MIHTPGHTPEHVSLFFDEWYVLTGDTLFVGDVGRVDLSLIDVEEAELRSRAKGLYESLQTILLLETTSRSTPATTRVLPAGAAWTAKRSLRSAASAARTLRFSSTKSSSSTTSSPTPHRSLKTSTR